MDSRVRGCDHGKGSTSFRGAVIPAQAGSIFLDRFPQSPARAGSRRF